MFRAGDKIFRTRKNKGGGSGAGNGNSGTRQFPFVTAANLFVCYSRPLARHKNHLGIVTSKKVGNAVRRNRARRLTREAWRLTAAEGLRGLDGCFETVIVLRAADWQNIKTAQVAAELDKSFFRRFRKFLGNATVFTEGPVAN